MCDAIDYLVQFRVSDTRGIIRVIMPFGLHALPANICWRNYRDIISECVGAKPCSVGFLFLPRPGTWNRADGDTIYTFNYTELLNTIMHEYTEQ